MEFQVVGLVHSPINDPKQMPKIGVPATVEILPEYVSSFQGIERSSHLVIIGWRGPTQPTELQEDAAEARNVETHMGRRKFDRTMVPNSLILCVSRLTGRVDGVLQLDRLDMVDGTAIIDVKPYSPLRGGAFSARTAGEGVLPDRPTMPTLGEMLIAAEYFHGERCLGIVLGARLMQHVIDAWGIEPRDPRLRVWTGDDGCLTDAIQAISGATIGNRRLKTPGGRSYRFAHGERVLAAYPKNTEYANLEAVLSADFDALFSVREEVAETSHQRADQMRHRYEIAPDLEQRLVERVKGSLVDGKLPCAVAYKIAEDVDVYVGEVGQVADDLGLKISRCQLGCFK